jgi:hypothetical protein
MGGRAWVGGHGWAGMAGRAWVGEHSDPPAGPARLGGNYIGWAGMAGQAWACVSAGRCSPEWLAGGPGRMSRPAVQGRGPGQRVASGAAPAAAAVPGGGVRLRGAGPRRSLSPQVRLAEVPAACG